MANISFRKAVREKVRGRFALLGPSGSGKTYSALLLASGMVKKIGGRIAFIDTEHERSKVYASEFDFDVLYLDPPYTPERFIEVIEAADTGEHTVLVVDSTSHEWMGPGGILDMKEKMPGTNDFAKWGKLTPRHNAFIHSIVASPLHVISTIRGKDKYQITKDSNNKTVVEKVGEGGQQREGFEYEMTCAWLLDMKHVADSVKDNTHLFEERYEKLTEQDGANIMVWANEGVEAVQKPTPTPQPATPNPASKKEPVKDEVTQWHEAIQKAVNDFPQIFGGDVWKEKLEMILNLTDVEKLEKTYQIMLEKIGEYEKTQKEAS